MKKLQDIARKIIITSRGWVPVLVFIIHVFLSHGLHLYEFVPFANPLMHFCGGLAIAFFISQSFQLLPKESVKRSHIVLLELILIGSLTATTAVFWEFAEFSIDQIFSRNVQVSLEGTMKDLAT